MKEFCTIHTHSVLCDGKNTLEEMARAAFEAGVVSFGASGHSHTLIPWDVGDVLPADTSGYQAEVLRLREVYKGRMDVLLGIEWDSQSDQSPPDWADYWIGSAHNLRDKNTGRCYCIDYDIPKLEACLQEMFGGNSLAMAEGYYEEAARVAAMRPTILGHFDMIVKLNGGNRYFDEDASRYRKAALDGLHAADPTASLLEINTGGVYRGHRETPYPALFILKEWKAMGGQIIFTADAHTTAGIAFGYDIAEEIAKEAGFTESVLLTQAGPRVSPF